MASDEDQPEHIDGQLFPEGNTSIHLARWVKAPPNDSPQCINPVKITATGILAFGTVGGKEGGVSIRCYPLRKDKVDGGPPSSTRSGTVRPSWPKIMAFRKSCKQGAPPSVPHINHFASLLFSLFVIYYSVAEPSPCGAYFFFNHEHTRCQRQRLR